ncbi:SlyX family protein [Pseudomarimonas salicorniae]|uniref:Protein SlyX homolog n=1 Tax=Pseudomarimonas salicorniae TaxID=2933270 RepID=A0ABT0GJY3_9GAMM|nr:SlyX family protein [Lysobacter sp. CAU 1642]MCK7594859.1 SlyX family protein [Lysobacter sp. CAU 1642]
MGEGLEQRVVDLEVRVAFQEQALNELSDALAASREEQTRSARRLEAALADLKALRGTLYADPSTEPPPPHY